MNPEQKKDLDHARVLAAHGVPLFVAPKANVEIGFALPKNWQHTQPDPTGAVVDEWEPGMALCAVMGHTVDVVDIDPRNGGNRSLEALGANWMPRSYGQLATPSGGTHDLIAALGVRKMIEVHPGIDVLSGTASGEGRGFQFLAPTEKSPHGGGDPVAYRWLTPPDEAALQQLELVGGDTTGAAVLQDIEETRKVAESVDDQPIDPGTEPTEQERDKAHAVLRKAVAAVAESDGMRNTTVNRWMLPLYRFVKGGCLDRDQVDDALWEAVPDAGGTYTRDEFEATRRSAWGAADPGRPRVSTPDDDFAVVGSDALSEFFQETPVLQQVQQAAHSRIVGAPGVLASLLSTVLLDAHPRLLLPDVVAGKASLNVGFALVGDSGASKSASAKVAADLLGRDADDRVKPVGSGEGMIDAFYDWFDVPKDPDHPAKGTKPQLQLLLEGDRARMFLVDEGETLRKLGERSGTTLTGFLRTALTGGTLGTTNAKASGRSRLVPANTYRLVMLADIHPEQADVLLDGDGVGMPQRFLWLPAMDPTMPNDVDDLPSWPGHLEDVLRALAPRTLVYPETIQREVRRAAHAKQRGLTNDPRTAHANLTRLKVAQALALLHGEPDITEQWWQLAGVLTDLSLATQEMCQQRLQAAEQKKHNYRAKAKAHADAGAEDSVLEDREAKAAGAVVEKLRKHPGEELPWGKAKPHGRLTSGLDTRDIVERLRGQAGITAWEKEVNGQVSYRLRYDP